jgi:hypothetical protein
MTYDALGAGALEYLPCRYGTSKLLFRGPRRSLNKPYLVFLGGTKPTENSLRIRSQNWLNRVLGGPV